MTDRLEFHPFADIFPLLEGEDFDSLMTDIKENGQHLSIVLYEGKILDGRNRYLACIKAGIEPEFDEYTGNNPLMFSMSLNGVRRHLTKSQLAMAAARLVNTQQGYNSNESCDSLVDRETAANVMGVGSQTVQRARKILEEGTEKEIHDVTHGVRTVNEVYSVIMMRNKPEEEDDTETIITRVSAEARIQGFVAQMKIQLGLFKDAVDGRYLDPVLKNALAVDLLQTAEECRSVASQLSPKSYIKSVR